MNVLHKTSFNVHLLLVGGGMYPFHSYSLSLPCHPLYAQLQCNFCTSNCLLTDVGDAMEFSLLTMNIFRFQHKIFMLYPNYKNVIYVFASINITRTFILLICSNRNASPNLFIAPSNSLHTKVKMFHAFCKPLFFGLYRDCAIQIL